MRIISLLRSYGDLHAMPTSAGYERLRSVDYRWDGKRRGNTPFTILQHTISGRGNLRFENRQIELRPGETFALIVPHNHCYWLEDGNEWDFFWISMNGMEALRIHEMVLNAKGPVFRLKSDTIDKLADCTMQLMEKGVLMPGRASAVCYEACMLLYDDIFGPSDRRWKEQNAVTRAIEFAMANLDRDLSVETLADAAGLSRAHFSRCFASFTGMSPAKYVQHQRMRLAARLLIANRNMSVKEVAILCGIPESNYFSKVFRKTYDVSPVDFRMSGKIKSIGSTDPLQFFRQKTGVRT
ncbi:AraC family transcriptional regulator [uncultured Cohaesibacter sp.]|uniref:AraC family transcriptional regulator n=1 Tax=uncultured Cohaesibacter sp. TaxID=1002546 RepID=UPI00292D87D4|nr:AraC family transcriptional regulator [uncultured Cohaesibacter sp.]